MRRRKIYVALAVAAVAALADGPAAALGNLTSQQAICADAARVEIDAQVAQLNTTAMEVLHEGEPIYRYGDVTRTEGLYVASVRKSLLALLYGPWVENGTIDLDAALEDLGIDDVGGLSPTEKQATVRHLITARSGVYHTAATSGDDPNKPPRGSARPGEQFVYNNWDFNVAGAIFEQLTGKSIYAAFDEQIARPIGLSDFDLELNESKRTPSDPTTGSIFPSYHFILSARDLAKIGQLVAQRGEWDGKQIVSKAWMNEMLSVHTTMAEVQKRRPGAPFAYGYMWWLPQGDVEPAVARGSALALGLWGQFILANPHLRLAAGHVTEPKFGATAEERKRLSTSPKEFAYVVQQAWDKFQLCGTLAQD